VSKPLEFQRKIWLYVFLLAMLCEGCQQRPEMRNAGEPQRSAAQMLYVHGAASTQEALNEALELYQKTHSIEIAANYASSATLAQQILQGSPADLFLSASREWVDLLAKENRIVRQQNLLENRLVLIVPKESKLKLASLEDLRIAEVVHLSLADPASVPAGKYAQQALEKGGVWNAVADRVARGSDVRQALAFVEQGEAEAGIVYATDAVASSAVRVVYEIPPALSGPIVYPLALIKPEPSTARASAAEELFNFLCSPTAAKIFRAHGFETPQN
jgi:molybdate transport system substrate-binding protein